MPGRPGPTIATLALTFYSQLNGYQAFFKLDTGSHVSIIPTQLLPRLRGVILKPLSIHLQGVTGTRLTTYGVVHASPIINGCEYPGPFIIADRPSDTVLLGLNWIQYYFPMAVASLATIGSREVEEITIDPSFRAQLEPIMKKFDALFASKLARLKPMHITPQRIETGGAKPTVVAPYRIKPGYRSEVDKQLSEMLAAGIIEPSNAPWMAPLVTVPKKDGKLRVCVDYRKLNGVTKRDEYRLPLPDDLFDIVGKAKFFSKLDAFSGFWQVPLHPDSREKTSFGLRGGGQFQFTVLPFGLTNAPAMFQRAMETALQPLLFRCVVVFVDDLLIYSETRDQHLQDIHAVFSQLQQFHISLNRDKCFFGQSSVNYLGFDISHGRCSPSADKIQAMIEMRSPTSRKELQSFIGLITYYRRFVPNFAKTAIPLYNLLNADKPWEWGANQESAAQALRTALAKATSLMLPDFDQQFTVTTDASAQGLGAILSQQQLGGSEHPICYISRRTTPPEANYSATDLECLAVKWALSKLRYYLIGRPFLLITDHSALLSILNRRSELTGMRARWVALLDEFQYTVKHRAGKDNPADALSRLLPTVSTIDEIIYEPQMRTILSMTDEEFNLEKHSGQEKRWRRRYRLLDNNIITTKNHRYGAGKIFLEGKPLRDQVIRVHQEGHGGVANTTKAVQSTTVGPNLWKIAQDVVQSCLACQLHDPSQAKANPLNPIEATDIGQILGIDIVGPLPRTPDGHEFIITAIDYFSRWPFARAVSRITTDDIIEFLQQEVIPVIGVPQQVISDRGTQFISDSILEFYRRLQITSTPSTAFHPQTNGAVERFNQTLQKLLRKLCLRTHDWNTQLWKALTIIRRSPNSTTSRTPAELLIGKNLKTPATWPATTAPVEEGINRTLDTWTKALEQIR